MVGELFVHVLMLLANFYFSLLTHMTDNQVTGCTHMCIRLHPRGLSSSAGMLSLGTSYLSAMSVMAVPTQIYPSGTG